LLRFKRKQSWLARFSLITQSKNSSFLLVVQKQKFAQLSKQKFTQRESSLNFQSENSLITQNKSPFSSHSSFKAKIRHLHLASKQTFIHRSKQASKAIQLSPSFQKLKV